MTGPVSTRVSDRTLRRLAWPVPVLLAAAFVVSGLVAAASPPVDHAGGSWEGGGLVAQALFGVAILAFPATGLLILRQQPRNRVGWVLQAIGLVWLLTTVAEAYTLYGLQTRPGSLPAAELVAALDAGLWAPGIGLMATFLLLVYPDGHLPSRRWRPVAWLSAVAIVMVTVVITLTPGPRGAGPRPDHPNPLGLESAPELMTALLVIFLPLLPLCIVASAAALVLRFRRSTGVERLQLTWLASGGAVVAALYAVSMLGTLTKGVAAQDQTVADPAWLTAVQTLTLLSFVLLPVSIGMAILRYRLYDIDVVVNRALVYGSLTAALAAVYLVSVLVLQLVLSPLTDKSDLAVAASTLAAAAVFRPARSRIQGVVDRRFFRRRYDAARTLDDFAARLRQEVDLEAVSADLRSVVRDTVSPAHASVWLRP